LPGVVRAQVDEGCVKIVCQPSLTAKELNRLCFENGIVLNRLVQQRKSLETTFLEITGKVSEQ
jgi:hypothetical protein